MSTHHDSTSKLKVPTWFLLGAIAAVNAIGFATYMHDTFETVSHAKEQIEETREAITRMHEADVKRWERMEDKIDRIYERDVIGRAPTGR